MSYKTEGFEDYDVPAIVQFLVKEGVLEDISFKQDTSPRFFLRDNDGADTGISLWIQHPLRGMREADNDEGRFLVEEGDLEKPGKTFDTDDLEEALSRILEFVAKDPDLYSEAMEGQGWWNPKDIPSSIVELSNFTQDHFGKK